MSGHSHLLGMLFCGLYEKEKDSPFIYVVFNMNWTPQELALPKLPEGLKWEVLSDTDTRNLKPLKKSEKDGKESVFTEFIADRSVRVYISTRDKNYRKKKETKRKSK
jgi:glycogen operon protein